MATSGLFLSPVSVQMLKIQCFGEHLSFYQQRTKKEKDGLFVVTLNLNVEGYFAVVVLSISFHFLGTT